MCRHLAYLGPPVPLARLLTEPPHGLYEQSWAPAPADATGRSTPTGSGWAGTRRAADDDPVDGGSAAGRYRRALPSGPTRTSPSWPVPSAAARCSPRSASATEADRAGRVGGGALPRRAAGCSATTAPCRTGPGCRAALLRPPNCSRWRPGRTPRCCGRWSRTGCGRASRPAGRWPRWSARSPRPGPPPGSTCCSPTDGPSPPPLGRHALVPRRPGRRRRGLRARRRRTRRLAARSPTARLLLATTDGVRVIPLRPERKDTLPMSRQPLHPRRPAARRRLHRRACTPTSAPASTARRRRCRPSGSTTRAAATCSSRSPRCPSTTRPAPSGRSCVRRAPEIAALTRAAHPDRAGLRLVEEDPAAARRAHRGRHAAALRPRWTSAPTALHEAGRALCRDYPDLRVHGHRRRLRAPGCRCTDEPGPRLRRVPRRHHRQLRPAERAAFLRHAGALARPATTCCCSAPTWSRTRRCWSAAYDDAAGVTAEFNKNVLHVLNRELGADFEPDAFEHVALWNSEEEWIEMRLRATTAQTVKIPDSICRWSSRRARTCGRSCRASSAASPSPGSCTRADSRSATGGPTRPPASPSSWPSPTSRYALAVPYPPRGAGAVTDGGAVRGRGNGATSHGGGAPGPQAQPPRRCRRTTGRRPAARAVPLAPEGERRTQRRPRAPQGEPPNAEAADRVRRWIRLNGGGPRS